MCELCAYSSRIYRRLLRNGAIKCSYRLVRTVRKQKLQYLSCISLAHIMHRYCLIQSALILILTLQFDVEFVREWNEQLIPSLDRIMNLLEKISDQDRLAQTILDMMAHARETRSEGGMSLTDPTLIGDDGALSCPLSLEETLNTWSWSLWNESFQL